MCKCEVGVLPIGAQEGGEVISVTCLAMVVSAEVWNSMASIPVTLTSTKSSLSVVLNELSYGGVCRGVELHGYHTSDTHVD